jgi:hypothetical protein
LRRADASSTLRGACPLSDTSPPYSHRANLALASPSMRRCRQVSPGVRPDGRRTSPLPVEIHTSDRAMGPWRVSRSEGVRGAGTWGRTTPTGTSLGQGRAQYPLGVPPRLADGGGCMVHANTHPISRGIALALHRQRQTRSLCRSSIRRPRVRAVAAVRLHDGSSNTAHSFRQTTRIPKPLLCVQLTKPSPLTTKLPPSVSLC